ncbi:MAG: DUF4198 domain-containing protein [Vicinamibacterales bacterium]
MKTRNALVVTIGFYVSVILGAHDFWLGVSTWRAAPGSRITVTANVGDRFPNPTSFTAPERVERVRLIGPGGEIEITPDFRREQNSLATDVHLPPDAGTYLVVMTIKPRFIEIKPPDFATYLSHEGLERVVEERQRRGETSKPGRERYSRYAKVLIRAGEQRSDHVTKPLGLPAELVPATDPTALRAGDSLTVRLLLDGRPVEGALVGGIYASSKGKPDEWPVRARTDARGEARLSLDHAGPWLLRTVHMVRREGESGREAVDWESYWASLAFDLQKQ